MTASSSKLTRILFIFSIAAVTIVSWRNFSASLSACIEDDHYSDEITSIKVALYFSRLQTVYGPAWEKELIAAHGPFDVSLAMIPIIKARLFPKYAAQLNSFRGNDPHWDYRLSRQENLARGVPITDDMVRSVRQISVIAGLLSCLALFLILWSLNLRVGALVSALSLSYNPLFISYAARAVPEIYLVLFSSVSVLCFMKSYRMLVKGAAWYLPLALLSALSAGIALLTKLTAAACVISYLCFLLLLLQRGGLDPRQRKRVLALLCILPLTVGVLFYLFHPYLHLHPVTGWAEIAKYRLDLMAQQRVEFWRFAVSLKDKLPLLPRELIRWAAPLPAASGHMRLFSLVVWGQAGLCLCGMIKGLRGYRALPAGGEAGNAFLLAVLWIFIFASLVVFLNCNWERYYMLPVYFYHIMFGIGMRV